jgi:hypothetical protein
MPDFRQTTGLKPRKNPIHHWTRFLSRELPENGKNSIGGRATMPINSSNHELTPEIARQIPDLKEYR